MARDQPRSRWNARPVSSIRWRGMPLYPTRTSQTWHLYRITRKPVLKSAAQPTTDPTTKPLVAKTMMPTTTPAVAPRPVKQVATPTTAPAAPQPKSRKLEFGVGEVALARLRFSDDETVEMRRLLRRRSLCDRIRSHSDRRYKIRSFTSTLVSAPATTRFPARTASPMESSAGWSR